VQWDKVLHSVWYCTVQYSETLHGTVQKCTVMSQRTIYPLSIDWSTPEHWLYITEYCTGNSDHQLSHRYTDRIYLSGGDISVLVSQWQYTRWRYIGASVTMTIYQVAIYPVIYLTQRYVTWCILWGTIYHIIHFLSEDISVVVSWVTIYWVM